MHCQPGYISWTRQPLQYMIFQSTCIHTPDFILADFLPTRDCGSYPKSNPDHIARLADIHRCPRPDDQLRAGFTREYFRLRWATRVIFYIAFCCVKYPWSQGRNGLSSFRPLASAPAHTLQLIAGSVMRCWKCFRKMTRVLRDALWIVT